MIEDLSDRAANLEDRLIGEDGDGQLDLRDVRYKLNDLRRTAINLRRYIAPQREALYRMSQLEEPWLEEGRVQGRFRETVNRVTRIAEELDEVREHAAVVQDEVANRIAQRMEKTMYALTLVATIMLPLGFFTGLLGVNVGGMPGTDTSWGFWAVCGGLAAMVVVEVLLFKKLKWF